MSIFRGNKSDTGGGIRITNNSIAELTGTIIEHNLAE